MCGPRSVLSGSSRVEPRPRGRVADLKEAHHSCRPCVPSQGAAQPAWSFPACRVAPCHALPGRVGVRHGVDQAYDLAQGRAGWRRRVGRRAHRAAEQADAADEGRLEASRGIMVGPVTADQGKVVRPSQLIRRVGRTRGGVGAW